MRKARDEARVALYQVALERSSTFGDQLGMLTDIIEARDRELVDEIAKWLASHGYDEAYHPVSAAIRQRFGGDGG